MTRIIGVGDNTVDTYLHKRMMFPGGNALNVPVLAHRYGHPAAYLGWLGKDERGDLILKALAEEDIDISHCRVIEGGATSFSTVTLVDGDRVFGESNHGATLMIKLEDEDYEYISTFDLVHTSVFSYLEAQIMDLKRASQRLSFDFSQKLDEDYLKKILPFVDIAFFSLADVDQKGMDELMHKAIQLGPSLVVMTRGKDGAWVFDGNKLYHQGVIPVQAVDTLGAGDAFAARFLVEYVDGTPIQAAMQRAAESAAQNCTWYGAFGRGVSY
jgi:fructoselysine 6-kinase